MPVCWHRHPGLARAYTLSRIWSVTSSQLIVQCSSDCQRVDHSTSFAKMWCDNSMLLCPLAEMAQLQDLLMSASDYSSGCPVPTQWLPGCGLSGLTRLVLREACRTLPPALVRRWFSSVHSGALPQTNVSIRRTEGSANALIAEAKRCNRRHGWRSSVSSGNRVCNVLMRQY